MKTVKLIQIALCGPSDVEEEIGIAKRVICALSDGELDGRGILLQPLHWRENASPDLAQRPQAVLNRQIVDKADIVVAVFWNRFGSSTGVYDSGTEEEIKRAHTLTKRVMVYFSKRFKTGPMDTVQLSNLDTFKCKLRFLGLVEEFESHDEFREKFTRQLLQSVGELLAPDTSKTDESGKAERPRTETNTTLNQSQRGGRGNFQAGFVNTLTVRSQKPKITIAPTPGCVSAEELKQIGEWIETLAEGDTGIARDRAFGKWGKMFNNAFNIPKRDLLPSSKMGDAQAWYEQQRKMQRIGYKTAAPDEWRNNAYAFIKARMSEMGRTNADYYPEVSSRLKMKRPFTSLKNLSKKDLERVYGVVSRDSDGR
jgi:hypothetical protein